MNEAIVTIVATTKDFRHEVELLTVYHSTEEALERVEKLKKQFPSLYIGLLNSDTKTEMRRAQYAQRDKKQKNIEIAKKLHKLAQIRKMTVGKAQNRINELINDARYYFADDSGSDWRKGYECEKEIALIKQAFGF